jgi:capsular polysaccharide transport system permease protein
MSVRVGLSESGNIEQQRKRNAFCSFFRGRTMRSAWQIQRASLSALFLREAVSRLGAGHYAWLGILLEPLANVIFYVTLFDFVFRRLIAGVEGGMFILTGLLGFLMARITALRCVDAISANAALFTYRQVLPVDTVLVRAALEGFLALSSALVLLAGAALLGYQVMPHDPLRVGLAVTGLWLCGAGLGLIFSVAGRLLPGSGMPLRMAFVPLYFLSGVMYPAMAVPQPWRGWLFINPLLHGLENLRAGFFPRFHMAPEASLSFLYGFALVAMLVGLALHVCFVDRLVAQ